MSFYGAISFNKRKQNLVVCLYSIRSRHLRKNEIGKTGITCLSISNEYILPCQYKRVVAELGFPAD